MLESPWQLATVDSLFGIAPGRLGMAGNKLGMAQEPSLPFFSSPLPPGKDSLVGSRRALLMGRPGRFFQPSGGGCWSSPVWVGANPDPSLIAGPFQRSVMLFWLCLRGLCDPELCHSQIPVEMVVLWLWLCGCTNVGLFLPKTPCYPAWTASLGLDMLCSYIELVLLINAKTIKSLF